MVAISRQSINWQLGSEVNHHGTQARVERFPRMDQRDHIKLTLERIKMARKLVAQQTEFIRLAKAIGFEPVHGTAVLQRFRTQLSDERATLLRLTPRARNRPLPLPSRAGLSQRQPGKSG